MKDNIELLEKMYQERRLIKELIRLDKERYSYLYTRALEIKNIINSNYRATTSETFMFFDSELANKITIEGIRTLQMERENKPKFFLSWYNTKNPIYTQSYIDWIEKVLGGYVTKYMGDADILIVPGGADIGKDEERDLCEIKWIHDFIDMDKPIFGICRGLQLLGKLEGCDLIQHIPDVTNILEHRSTENNFEGHSTFHPIYSEGKPIFEVNSRHHQGFKFPAAMNSEDGIVEAMGPVDVAKHLGRQGNLQYLKYFACQWHPEREEMWEDDSQQYVKLRINDLLPANKQIKVV